MTRRKPSRWRPSEATMGGARNDAGNFDSNELPGRAGESNHRRRLLAPTPRGARGPARTGQASSPLAPFALAKRWIASGRCSREGEPGRLPPL